MIGIIEREILHPSICVIRVIRGQSCLGFGAWDLELTASQLLGIWDFRLSAASMAESNPAELTGCDCAAPTRVPQKGNRSAVRNGILRSTAGRNRPGGLVKHIVAADARAPGQVVPANRAMPYRGLQGPRAR
jgi:hypothetical protein